MGVREQPIDGAESTTEQPASARPLTETTGFQRNLLLSIASLEGTNPNGVEIKRTLEQHYDEDLNEGRLYQNLRELLTTGHVEKLPLDGRTNAYYLTDQGRERLLAHRQWADDCLTDEARAEE